MWFFLLIIAFYSLILFYFTHIWNKKSAISQDKLTSKISVIVPFKDEERHLPRLISSLKQLEYPFTFVEFIFVNDHSVDQSLKVLYQLLHEFPFQQQVISLPKGIFGKKRAIEYAVEKAQNPIILCTDADCELPQNWLERMQQPFQMATIHVVSGNVVFKSNTFLDKLFQMEFSPLIGVGGVSIRLGNPGLANGANIAFRKKTFVELDVFSDNIHIPTGDDIFLVQKIAKEYPKGIIFQKDSIVKTNPPGNLTAFFHQRVRWASKWKAASSRKNKFPAIGVWSFHLIYLIGVIGFIREGNLLLAIFLVVPKLVAEFLFLFNILRSQGQKFNFIAFLILQLLYSIYVIIFGLMANISAYQWKGRIYGKHER